MRADNEGRLAHWQSAPGSSPATTDDYLYDGEGARVAQVVTTSSSTSSVYYLLGGAEEVSISGGTTTLTKYFSAPGLPTAMRVGSTISYLASDGLGSVTAAFDGSGNLEAAQLYLPYGEGTRYSTGSMPTTRGYTGQRADATTGLYYYNARYYDPTTQQFTSPDSAKGSGLNRYAYVGDNPTSRTDPTGHTATCGSNCSHYQQVAPPNHCAGQGPDCAAIYSTFTNKNTIQVLLMLDLTPMGHQFLQFVLAVGAKLGDSYIRWVNLGSIGDTNVVGEATGGYILLNSELIDYKHPGSCLGCNFDPKTGNSSVDWKYVTSIFVHEAVESYYSITYGMRCTCTQHADYVAEWYAGEYLTQAGYNNLARDNGVDKNGHPIWDAYHMVFDDGKGGGWINSNDGHNYNDPHGNQEFKYQPEAYLPPGTTGFLLGFVLDYEHMTGTWIGPVPNPANLTLATLSSNYI